MASEENATVAIANNDNTSELLSLQNTEVARIAALAEFIRTNRLVSDSLDENPTSEKYQTSLQLGYMEKELGFDKLYEQRVKAASDAISEFANSDTRSKLMNEIIDIHLQHGNIEAAYEITEKNDLFGSAQKLPDIYRSQISVNDKSWQNHAKITSKKLISMGEHLVKSDPNRLYFNVALNKFIELYCETGAIPEALNLLSEISDNNQKTKANITVANALYTEGKLQEYKTFCRILKTSSVTPDSDENTYLQYIDMLIQTNNLDEALSQIESSGSKKFIGDIERYIHVAEKYLPLKPDRAAVIIRDVIKAIKLIPTYNTNIKHEVYQHAVHLYMKIDKPKLEDNLLLTATSDFKSSSCGVMQCYAAYEYAQAGNNEAAKQCAEISVRHKYTSPKGGEDKITIIKLYELFESLGQKEEAQQTWNRLEDNYKSEYIHKRFMDSSLSTDPEELNKYLTELKQKLKEGSPVYSFMNLSPYITEISLLLENTQEVYSLISKVPTFSDRLEITKALLQFHGTKLKQVFDNGVEPIRFEQLRSQLMNQHGALNRSLMRDIGIVIQNAETAQRIIDILPTQSKLEAKFLMYREATQYKTGFAESEKNAILEDTKNQLRKSLDAGQIRHISNLTQILVNLSTKEAGDILLTHARELYEKDFSTDSRLITLFASTLTEVNTFRGNDLVFAIASDTRISPQISKFLYDRLIKNGYLSKDIQEWLDEQNKNVTATQRNEKLLHEAQQIESIKIISRAGILPSHEVLTFLVNEPWQNSQGMDVIDLQERIELVKTYLSETDKTTDSTELVKMLHSDRKIAMAYYIQHNREIRFDLVNNYSFEKFWDILGIIDSLEVHETPLNEFTQSLSRAGFTQEQIEPMVANLRNGHHPWFSAHEPEIGESILLDVSNQQVYEQKLDELRNAFGDQGLGICLMTPYARKYLEERIEQKGRNYELAVKLLEKLNTSSNMWERRRILDDIENEFQFYMKICNELREPWNELRSKLSIAQVQINDMLNNHYPPISAEALIYAVENRRQQLKSAKKELIASLQLDNPQMRSLTQEIRKKRKAAQELRKGLERNQGLQPRIDEIEHEVEALEIQLSEIGSSSVTNRFASVTDDERNKMLDDAKKEFESLSSKDAAPLLVYMIAELIDHMPILESDVNVMREVSSHLSSPMTMIAQLRDIETVRTSGEQLKRIGLSYVDKHKDLMRMLRFADSKICCFSSSNYDMRVAHNTENKYWVASINKDPLSFVFELQEPDTKNNTGFVFGSFGIDEDGYPAILLNGIYLSSGNTKGSVNNILDSIEKNFARRIRAKMIAISNIYGGKMSQMPNGYTESDIVLRRLRALDDGRGNPETKIYDDLSQSINGWKTYGSPNTTDSLAHEGTTYHKVLYQ